MKQPLVIYWARRDLRLHDNQALCAAAEASRKSQAPFLPLFILEDYMVAGDPEYQFGVPSRWFLSRAIPSFAKQFSSFALVRGKAALYFKTLAQTYDITIYVNDDVYVDFYTQVEKILSYGIEIKVCDDALTIPKETRTGEGNLYTVFTPFKRNVWNHFVSAKPVPVFEHGSTLEFLPPKEVPSLPQTLEADTEMIESLCSTRRLCKVADEIIDLAALTPIPELEGWYTTEAEAMTRFKDYLQSGDLAAYKTNRDSLELDVLKINDPRTAYTGKTSKMSLALAWGLVSPRTLLKLMQKHFDESFDNPDSSRVEQGALTYISELIWREFYRYQLFHRPELIHTEFQKKFQNTIAWAPSEVAKERFILWILGKTGYPVVDAAMKQIASTGWMHNRSRMIVSSVLTKNLGVDWRWGQEYFRATLIDLDEASNCGGWQWGASVGADPKPIRIFNPELQAKKFDGEGRYQSHWLGSTTDFALQSTTLPILEQKTARVEALRRYGLLK
jgi:deoxyribodipyrimidine photo-lyase